MRSVEVADRPAAEGAQRDAVNVLRALAMDAVQKANSGHPGMPMGMAEIAEVLWRRALRHNPGHPAWCDRDRFVLSNGHNSMLPVPGARAAEEAANVRRGGYVLVEPREPPHAVIIATGSEILLAVEAQKRLAQSGMPVRVVSMPETTVFDRQDESYRDRVLPSGLPAVAVEAGVPDFWRKYVGRSGAVIGIDRFGDSAPVGELFRHLGFTPERVVEGVNNTVRRRVERPRSTGAHTAS